MPSLESLQKIHVSFYSRIPCYLCTKTFTRKRDMLRHIANTHEKTAIDDLKICSKCIIEFKDEQTFKIHMMQVHSYWKNCSKCIKEFRSELEYQDHMSLLHSSEINRVDISVDEGSQRGLDSQNDNQNAVNYVKVKEEPEVSLFYIVA